MNRPTSLRTAWPLVGIMVLLIALSACGGDVTSQVPIKAPGFSLMSGLGDRVTLDELLEGQKAAVVVFYRGFS